MTERDVIARSRATKQSLPVKIIATDHYRHSFNQACDAEKRKFLFSTECNSHLCLFLGYLIPSVGSAE
jgi:hypothetical protein